MTFNRFAPSFTEMNNFLPIFPVLNFSNKMTHEDLSEILLRAVTNAWAKQSHLQLCYFEMKTYKETCAMFKQMEISEQVDEGGTPSKTPTRSDDNRDVCVRKKRGG